MDFYASCQDSYHFAECVWQYIIILHDLSEVLMFYILLTGYERAIQFCSGLCERMSWHWLGETTVYPGSADKLYSLPLIIYWRIACIKRSVLFSRCNRWSVKLRNTVYVRPTKSVQSLQSSQSLWTHRGHCHLQVREISALYWLNMRSVI